MFGLGCGSNNDMSVDGAVLWYAGISAASVAQTNYYTTPYDKGGLFGGGWCNMLTNALLVPTVQLLHHLSLLSFLFAID